MHNHNKLERGRTLIGFKCLLGFLFFACSYFFLYEIFFISAHFMYREALIISVKNLAGLVTINADGSWVCEGSHKKELHSDPVSCFHVIFLSVCFLSKIKFAWIIDNFLIQFSNERYELKTLFTKPDEECCKRNKFNLHLG